MTVSVPSTPNGATARCPLGPGELARCEHNGFTVALGGHPTLGPWVQMWTGPGSLPAEFWAPEDVTVVANMVRAAQRWLTPPVADNQLSLLETAP